MADYDAVLELARKLGKMMADHPRAQAFLTAQRAVQGDAASRELLDQYRKAAAAVQEKEAKQLPIEVADKQALAEAEQAMAGSDTLKTLTRAQADYLELMHAVNREMDQQMAAAVHSAAPSDN